MKHTQMLLAGTGSCVIALLALSACERGAATREIDWARSALARNPAYEIIATDEKSGVFTVRDKATGEVSTLRVGDLVAAPPPAKPAAISAQAAAPATAKPEPAATPGEAAAPAAEPAPAPTLANNPTTHDDRTAPAASGPKLAEGPGYSISRGQHTDAPAPTPQTLEGPGYSITREESQQRAAQRGAEAVATNVERRSDPIICQGDRLMHIDGETLEFTGDALIAEKGCDLYISNARIRAGGVGLIARQARVHIVNSTIGGSRASYEASEGAEIYVARSTFAGIGRRFDSASMTDLGGNSYSAH